MSRLCVVHLVRRKNGIEPFRQFLLSYATCPGGMDHELVLLFKGFSRPNQMHAYELLARDVPHRALRIPDRGLDIGSYFRAAQLLTCDYLCFLNSYARPLDPEWLKKMWVHLCQPDVGVVGATASFQSFHSRHAELLDPVRDASLPTRLCHFWQILWSQRDAATLRRRFASLGLRLLGLHHPLRDYPPFPNPHLRTNGFAIARRTMLTLTGGTITTKHAAFRFESGRDSMTNQLLRMGKRVLVVGRDGQAYEPRNWAQSGTFRSGTQANLLIADNQTEAYASADAATRRQLTAYAWGNDIAPKC